ncbi:MAG: ABC transporter permease [Deltaproteobacteria bacterium]
MNALRGLLRKEWRHIMRDKRTLAVIILMPVVQVILFGYAIRTDVKDIRLVIVDPAPDHVTLEIRDRLEATEAFRTVAVLPTSERLNRMFQKGEAEEAVVFEPRFASRLERGLPARIEVIADATEPNAGSTRQNYAMAVIRQYERDRGEPAPGVQISARLRTRFDPTAESSHLFVPGLMAFVLTIISALMTAISLTREKETGTMETLLVSPLRPWQIIVGKVAPYMVVGFVSVILVIVEARLVFQVPLRGSVVLLLAEGLLYILVSLSLGMLISSRTNSQRVAMMGAMIGTMLPTMLLSGFIFPIESMPTVLQWVANVIPAKWFVTIARSIMLKGTGLAYLWQETLILCGMAVALLGLATRSFHTRLE